MPSVWDARQHERLLLLMIDQLKPKCADLAAAWKQEYGADESNYVPTAKALEEHIKALRRDAKNRGSAIATPASARTKVATPVKQNRTPSKKPASAAKSSARTPKSGGKRKRGNSVDDESSMNDDITTEEDFSSIGLTEMASKAPRRSSSRPSSQVKKAYVESEDEMETANTRKKTDTPNGGIRRKLDFGVSESDHSNFSANELT